MQLMNSKAVYIPTAVVMPIQWSQWKLVHKYCWRHCCWGRGWITWTLLTFSGLVGVKSLVKSHARMVLCETGEVVSLPVCLYEQRWRCSAKFSVFRYYSLAS